MRSRVLSILTLLSLGLLCVGLFAQSGQPGPSEPKTIDSSAGQATKAPASTSSKAVSPQDSTKKDNNNATAQAPEKHKLRSHLGGFSIAAGYRHYSGPVYYPYAYPYAFGPFGLYPGDWVAASCWYPLWSPYPYYGPGAFVYGNGRGELRLAADPKEAQVFIDGGYAGTADKLKSLWLDPGAYDLMVSAAGREDFHQRVYMLSGKSLKIAAKLNPERSKERP